MISFEAKEYSSPSRGPEITQALVEVILTDSQEARESLRQLRENVSESSGILLGEESSRITMLAENIIDRYSSEERE